MRKAKISITCLALLCAAALRPLPAFCEEQEQKKIYLPADISKTLTFQPIKDQSAVSASKSSDTTASSEYRAATAASAHGTYIFMNKEDKDASNQKRWTTPSKKAAKSTAQNPTKKTKVKKLEVSRAGFADTSFSKNAPKANSMKDRKSEDDGMGAIVK